MMRNRRDAPVGIAVGLTAGAVFAALFAPVPVEGRVKKVVASSTNYQMAWQDISGGGTTSSSPSFRATSNFGVVVNGTGSSPSFGIDYEQPDEGEIPVGILPQDPIARSLSSFLGHAYPNPFNPVTKIPFRLAESGRATLRIYNVGGQLVRTLVDETLAAGEIHRVVWDGRNNQGQPVASGVYFYHLVARRFTAAKKFVLLK